VVRIAPEWEVEHWLNAPPDTKLADFEGKVVVALAFQMLCPGCVQLAVPQIRQLRQNFTPEDLVVLGLHTVFEHHHAMGRQALEVFAHEYRLSFPIAIDMPGETAIPRTMERYAMQGTPTLLLIDRQRQLRMQRFGHVPDLELGFQVGKLL
jgi:hypothetical protein